jgi:Tfp pilus assembly protein FimV
VAVGVAVGLGFVGDRGSAGPASPAAARAVMVHRGDTVWAIAQRVVGPSADPRPMVQALIDANHLPGGVINVGERLIVPTP